MPHDVRAEGSSGREEPHFFATNRRIAPANRDGSLRKSDQLVGRDLLAEYRSREIVGDSDIEVYSEGSPLGTAIIGMKVGDETSYTAPNGKSIDVKIVKVETYVP